MALDAYVRNINSALRLKEYMGNAAPTDLGDGTFNVGDRVRNTAPSAAGPPGWVCTTATVPGTTPAVFKAEANVAS